MSRLFTYLRDLPSTTIRLASGVALLGLALPISFFNAIAAGFFFITGLLCCLTLVIDMQRLKTLNVSLTSIQAEMFEKIERKVEDAESILAEIRNVEARISYILTEQMLNRGGNKYVGGFGEEAEFAIYRALAETNAAKENEAVKTNLQSLKLRLGFHLCNAVFGYVWENTEAAITVHLRKNNYKSLPSMEDMRQLATADGVDLSRNPSVLDAYQHFLEKDILPSQAVIRALYDAKYFGAPFHNSTVAK